MSAVRAIVEGKGFRPTVAQEILDVLKAAGYAIVELPTEFSLEVRRGRIISHGRITGYAPQEARDLAAALLAAADAAEVADA